MSVIAAYAPVRETGDGYKVAFDFDFKVLNSSDLVVGKILNSTEVLTTLVLGVDYTVVLNTITDGGTVTYTVAPTASQDSFISRSVPVTQPSDIPTNNIFRETQIENALDRATMILQQNDEELGRCIKLPATSSGVEPTLEAPEDGKVLAWDGTSGNIKNVPSGSENLELIEDIADEAAASAAAAAASAAAAAASVAANSGTINTFTDADLSAGILTITHSLGLTAPYLISFGIANENNEIIAPDNVTFGANSITVDLSSFGTLSGTWSYLYGGSPNSVIPLPDPTGEDPLNILRVNAGGTAYETVNPADLFTEFDPTAPGPIGGTTPDTIKGTEIEATTILKLGTPVQGSVLYDNGTSLIKLPPGTSGQYLKSQGAGANPIWGTINSTGGNQLFTSSGTFTAPAGITKVYVSMCGGGGGGSYGSNGIKGAGGGGGGWIIQRPFTVIPGNNYTVTIGAGGNGGVVSGSVLPTAGGTTSFDSLSVPGGAVGVSGSAGGAGGGAGFNASNLTPGGYVSAGGNGALATSAPEGGAGGGTPFGSGAAGNAAGVASNNAAANSGGGGSGGAGNSAQDGGAGGSGIVLVQY